MLALDKRALRDFLFKEGYAYDWLAAGLVILINFGVPTYLLLPVERPYSANDPALSYPYKEDTVSDVAAGVITFCMPAAAFAAACIFFRTPIVDWHHAYLSFIEAFSLACGWKRWMNLTGRLRPHWLAVLSSGHAEQIAKGRLSYPSGHTSYLFVSATVLSLWACGKLQVFARPSQAVYLKLLLCLSPLWLATFVGCSRIYDFKHDFSDVNAGGFIGIACGIVGYSLNFPSLFSLQSDQPKRRGSVGVAQAPSAQRWRPVMMDEMERGILTVNEGRPEPSLAASDLEAGLRKP